MRNIIKKIPGFSNYFINKDGDVYSCRHKKDFYKLKAFKRAGYLSLQLCNGKPYKTYTKSIHALLLLTFKRPPKKGEQARHLNGDKTDNRLANLKWGSAKENAADMVMHGTASRGDRHGCRKISSADAKEIRTSKDSRRCLSEKFSLHITTIDKIKSGRTWKI